LFNGEDPEDVADFFDTATELGVEGITVSPGYSYHHAPKQDVFLARNASKQLFRSIFSLRRRPSGISWSFNHSALFLDFLAGNQTYQCTPWSNPTYNIFGWQRPCYLLSDEGYAPSYRSLIDDTEWDKYGVGKNPRCDNCMAHCGFEGTAVNDAFSHPLKALKVWLRGPRIAGPMAPDLPIKYADAARYATVAEIPLSEIKRVSRESA
jgi:hopanoid biosynthesis associated radical SAM protein HpnH